jgi:hypothetical protein
MVTIVVCSNGKPGELETLMPGLMSTTQMAYLANEDILDLFLSEERESVSVGLTPNVTKMIRENRLVSRF